MSYRITRILRFNSLLAVFLILASGCGKRPCQAPLEAPVESITNQEWRMVESPDNILQTTNTTFTIWSFASNFAGQIFPVIKNNRDEAPSLTFDYDIDENGDLVVDFIDSSNPDGPKSRVVYNYELGRELEITDENGNYYRFVPFQGVVEPDRECTF